MTCSATYAQIRETRETLTSSQLCLNISNTKATKFLPRGGRVWSRSSVLGRRVRRRRIRRGRVRRCRVVWRLGRVVGRLLVAVGCGRLVAVGGRVVGWWGLVVRTGLRRVTRLGRVARLRRVARLGIVARLRRVVRLRGVAVREGVASARYAVPGRSSDTAADAVGDVVDVLLAQIVAVDRSDAIGTVEKTRRSITFVICLSGIPLARSSQINTPPLQMSKQPLMHRSSEFSEHLNTVTSLYYVLNRRPRPRYI